MCASLLSIYYRKNGNGMIRLWKRTGAVVLAGIMMLSSLGGCQKQKEETMDQHIKVETQAAQAGTLEITTEYIASLSPNLTVDVVPLVAATAESVLVKVGDKVKSGDLLCQLDSTSADLSVQSAQDAVNSAKAGEEAAQIQAKTARLQAQGNVKTLKKTLKAYQDSLDTAKAQLRKLQKSRKSIIKGRNQAQKLYAQTKKRYKIAQRLRIQFESFLEENSDCRTTAGLTTAATGLSLNPADYTAATAPGPQPVQDTSQDEAKNDAKMKQAQILLKALQEAGLTVEYLSATGVEALKEDVSDGETAYNSVAASLTQLDTSIATLQGNITQLKGQITTTKDSLDTANKLLAAASDGSEAYDAQIEAAETGVSAAEYQKDLYTLTSPIDGVVDAVNIKQNGLAAQGMPAFTISEKESMIAAFYVPEEVRNFLKIGDPVTLLKDDEEDPDSFGHITSIGTVVDPQKGLFKIEAEIYTTGQKELAGGTSVKLSIVSNAVEGQILIPYDSVYYDDGQAYVYRVINDKALRTDIDTGAFNEEQIAVTSGLNEGDSIITTWASGLKDGAQVKIIDHGEETE